MWYLIVYLVQSTLHAAASGGFEEGATFTTKATVHSVFVQRKQTLNAFGGVCLFSTAKEYYEASRQQEQSIILSVLFARQLMSALLCGCS